MGQGDFVVFMHVVRPFRACPDRSRGSRHGRGGACTRPRPVLTSPC